MKQFELHQKLWFYSYDYGLASVELYNTTVNRAGYTTILLNNIKKVVLLSQLFESKKLAMDYATAINFKRGWLQREFEKHPDNLTYKAQKRDSIESFPEMWI